MFCCGDGHLFWIYISRTEGARAAEREERREESQVLNIFIN